ncbi:MULTISPECIES: hypothetical protein [Cryobacterium]|uniref:Uncharacterized protein n=1 Tax=Cryobacterium levicorallinum TaxID=995038 RepID=A0A1I2ZKU3_9MICO|nr:MULTISPECIES: hypothetical protein [Cryobacterium]TFB89518.1 hypothetical protein E3O11_00465 [Cryobacterium levicorallinum]TFD51635.1 hypothetical protein E3T46_08100 [Cryobacterium sp. Hh11]TFD56641.1 hypothetical protein E3T41_15790 [Cryobacterium sp. Hh38]SFH38089.1 hypothetical protein SAMN05216274_104101 [Cryobacterium levicorallinum]GEP25855.1 hypothetical protein CLE01_04530 [Cryobacterium levicorallinum]
MTFTATIVAQVQRTKPDALWAIATALSREVSGTSAADAFIALPDGGRVEVEIAKFGESLPLAIDVVDARGAAEARASAQNILDLLEQSTGWQVDHLHD